MPTQCPSISDVASERIENCQCKPSQGITIVGKKVFLGKEYFGKIFSQETKGNYVEFKVKCKSKNKHLNGKEFILHAVIDKNEQE